MGKSKKEEKEMSNLFESLTEREEPISLVNRLSKSVNETYYDIGCVLYHLREDDHYKTIDGNKYYSNGHKKWKEFCEDKLDISYRSAQYWLNIYRYFNDMGISKERLSQIGWSKAKEFIDVTDDVNVLEAGLKVAETGTIQDVQYWKANIETQIEKLGEDNRETLKSKTFNFKFYEAAGETVEQILQDAAQQTNGNLNEALFMIVVEWYQSKATTNTDVSILTYDTEETEEELLQAVG